MHIYRGDSSRGGGGSSYRQQKLELESDKKALFAKKEEKVEEYDFNYYMKLYGMDQSGGQKDREGDESPPRRTVKKGNSR